MLNIGDILTLSDDNKYSVVYITKIDGKDYVYLIDQNDYTNTMFCEYDNKDGLEEVTDPEIAEQIMKNFQETYSEK